MPDVTKIDATIHFTPPNKTLSYAFGARRVALYCRVSSKMEKQLNSLSAQIDFMTQDIIDHPGWEHVGTYTDIGSGKSISSRPGFKRMIADCESGKIDLIYTKSVSRFGRNCVDFLITLRRLKELNVEIYFENEKILSSSAAGELMLTIHSAVAQMESENKSANIKWGIKRSTTNPNSPAFSRICFGYDRDETKNLIINEKESDIVKKIFEWYIQGWSIIRIKKELEILRIPSPMGKRRWPVRTIADILSNEKYTGDSLYGRTASAEFLAAKRFKNDFDDVQRSFNHHPPIIDKETFVLVQEMKKMRSNIEIDEQGNKVRKTTHYSMKQSLTTIEKTTKL